MIVSPEINCPKCGSDMMMQMNCPEPVDFETKMKEIEKYFNEINFDDLEEENREE
jgi:DNA-directed RNA polymerase subunit RPC12/RpoP